VSLFECAHVFSRCALGGGRVWNPHLKRHHMYSNSILARYKLGNIPAISLLGAANLIFFGFLDYFSLLNPAVSGPDWTRSIGTLIGIFLLGVVSYFLVTRYYHSKGIDVSLAFKEIPPE